jgi:hypothetical protein
VTEEEEEYIIMESEGDQSQLGEEAREFLE